jgi:PAS domain S-box-containing protein
MKSRPSHDNIEHSASGIVRFAWLSIPIFLALVGFFWLAELKVVLEPPYLLPLLNFIFSTAVSVFVAYLAAISFARNASLTVLMLGSGMLFFGTVSLIAAIMVQLGHINAALTVYNTGVLFSGICHGLAAAALIIESRVNRDAILILSATYALVLTVTGLLTYAAAKGLTPVFFIQGIGPTPLRQAVLGTAVGVHVLCGVLIAIVSRRFHWLFGQWYALSLSMIAIGLFGVLMISHVGSPLGWSGRVAQYIGGLYMLMAVLAAAREGGEWDAALQSALKESQERYRQLLNVLPAAMYTCNAEGVITYFNSQAAHIWGRKPDIGETDERFCGSFRLYRPDGTHLPHSKTPMAVVLRDGSRVQGQEVIIERPDHSRVWVSVNIDPQFDEKNRIRGAINVFTDITARKRTEESLKLTQMSVDVAGEMIGWTTPDGKIYYVNDATCRSLGYSRDEIIKMTLFDLNPDLTPELHEHIWKEVRERKSFTVETTHRRKDGSVYPAEMTVHHIQYQGQEYRIAFGRDITERKRVEEALQASQTELLKAQQIAHIGSWTRDARIDKDTCSDELLRIYGFDPAKQAMPNFTDQRGLWYPPEEWDRLAAAVEESARTGVGYDMEMQALRNGQRIWVQTRSEAMRDAEGRIVGLRGTVQDITERKRSEQALRESEEKFRTVFEQAAVGMGRVSFSDLRWIEVNETFCRMLGYSREELLEIPWPQITHPEDVDLDLIPFRQMAAGKLDNYTVEKRFIHKKGHHVWARLTLSLVRDAKGLPHYEIAVIENISDRKKAQEALQESEGRYRLLFTNISEGFALGEALFDKNGAPSEFCFLEINDAFERQTGLTKEILGRPITEVLPNLERQWIDSYCAVAVSGKPVRFKNYNQDTGRHYDVFCYSPSTNRFAILFRDVTEQVKNEKALRQMNETLQEQTQRLQRQSEELQAQAEELSHANQELQRTHGLIESITKGTDDLIAAQDVDFRYIYFNDAYRREFAKLWGRQIETGTSMIEALSPWPQDQRKARDLWARALHGESFSITEAFGPTEPEKQVYQLQFNPVYDSQNRQIGAAHILRNVTEQVRLQQKLLLMNETLEQQVAERTKLAEARSKQLQSMAVELIETEERERRKFAHLLHDDLQQMLAAANMQLQVLADTIPNELALVDVGLIIKGVDRKITPPFT